MLPALLSCHPLLPSAPCRVLLVLGGAASLALGLFTFVVRAACMHTNCMLAQHGQINRQLLTTANMGRSFGPAQVAPLLPPLSHPWLAAVQQDRYYRVRLGHVGRSAALCCGTQGAETRERTPEYTACCQHFAPTPGCSRMRPRPSLLACGASSGSGTSGLHCDVPLPLPLAPPTHSCWCR